MHTQWGLRLPKWACKGSIGVQMTGNQGTKARGVLGEWGSKGRKTEARMKRGTIRNAALREAIAEIVPEDLTEDAENVSTPASGHPHSR